jgi:hypothetical protein
MNEHPRVEVDEGGREWLLDANGQPVLDEAGDRVPPTHTSQSTTHSGFRVYDTSQGHCGLCGRLGCNGRCFK